MALRRNAKKQPAKTGRIPFSMIFWVAFVIALVSLFLIFLLPLVRKGITLPKPATQEQPAQEPVVQEPRAQPKPPEEKPPERPSERPPRETRPERPSGERPAESPPGGTRPERPSGERPRERPSERPPGETRPERPPRETSPQAEKPPEPPPAQQPTEQRPPETRDRSVYFMRDGGAELTLAKVSRKLAISDSPLIDCVNALLAGPSAEEKNRGLASFIPPNTRLLSARVVNNTVHLNFNEAFRYNTSGREGSAAQLQQIVWTATEFPNVNNVQIEIEGKIVDFLVEGIAIRNPIGR